MSKKLFSRIVPVVVVVSALGLVALAGCSMQNDSVNTPGEVIEEAIVEDVPGTGSEDADALMTEDEAKAIAFEDAGVAEADATNVKVEKKSEDGVEVYEIKFDAKGTSYDYVIDAKTGSLIEFDEETMIGGATGGTGGTTGSSGSSGAGTGTSN